METTRVGAVPAPPEQGTVARDMVDLSRPALDFVALASGMGVPASRATTAEEFAAQFGKALAEPGPHLIEAVVPPLG
jgi:acetolactate synthase-1/2/3 large subunit